MTRHWPWSIRLFYGPETAMPGQVAGEVTVHSLQAKNAEVAQARRRPDIGRIDVQDVQHAGGWMGVYYESALAGYPADRAGRI